MAEGDGVIYNIFKYSILNGEYDLDVGADTINAMLVSAYTPDIDAHTGYASVSGDEYTTASGYTATGQALTSKATSQDNANDRGKWDAADTTWTSLGPLSPAIPSDAILYDDTHAAKLLILYFEIGVTATNGGNYTLSYGTDGIILTV